MIVKWYTFGLYRLCDGHFVTSDLTEPGGDVYVIGKAYHPPLGTPPCDRTDWSRWLMLPGIVVATNGDDFIKVADDSIGASRDWVINSPPTINGFLMSYEDRDFIRSEVKKWLDKWWRPDE